MRYLHNVGVSEKFVASGVYVESHSDSIEAWTIHALPDGARMIRADREIAGQVTLTEAWQAPQSEGGEIERIDTYTYGKGNTPIRATMMREGDTLIITAKHGREEAEEFSYPLEANARLIPTGYVFMGVSITENVRPSVRPSLENLQIPQFAAARESTDFESWVLVESDDSLGGRPARVFRAGNWLAWLDEHDMVLQLLDDRGAVIRLKDYARSK